MGGKYVTEYDIVDVRRTIHYSTNIIGIVQY